MSVHTAQPPRPTVLPMSTTATPSWIGPRKVGGVYRNGYWGMTYTVLAVTADAITERDLDGPNAGRIRVHRTAWDKRDSVVEA